MYMERTSQAGFPVIKNNAISNCNNITSHSQQANGRFYTHLSIGDVTRNDSQRRFFAQHSITTLCCDIVSNGCNIVPTLLRCVELKIVVVNRPV